MVFLPSSPDFARGRLSLTFLDVGQGDAIVISFPQGQIMLLDCGGRPSFGVNQQGIEGEPIFIEDRAGIGARAVAPFLWYKGVGRIDHLAASHSDSDHVQGFSEIARDFPFETAISAASELKDPFPAVVAQARPRRRQLWRGDRLEIEGAVIDVLAPFADRDATSLSSNNRSLVWRLTYGSRRFLLAGDIERAIEGRLASTSDDLRADVLKIAHHGSRTSSTAEFLSRVSPVLAVISVASPSPYGHPHPEVLARLETTGAKLFTTSRCGAITISTDGNDLQVETFTNCK
jgi:competence protein ComEC